MEFLMSGCSDKGIVKKTNQDSYMGKIISTQMGSVAFAILCDGMGGLSKGEAASSTVINAFREWSEKELPRFCEMGLDKWLIQNTWNRIIDTCNETLIAYGRNNHIQIGTTLTAILITEEDYFVINVGDSRAYEVNNGVHLLTKDQTLVERDVDLGLITREQAEVDPRRNILLQCIGGARKANADFYYGDVEPNSVFFLCSDGFRHEISDAELFQYLKPSGIKTSDDIKIQLNDLVELNKQRMERDNISAIAIKVVGTS